MAMQSALFPEDTGLPTPAPSDLPSPESSETSTLSTRTIPFPELTEEQLQMTEAMPPSSAPPPRRLLFFTNSDAGQANPVLAVVQQIIIDAPNVEVHVAGDAGIYARVNDSIHHNFPQLPQVSGFMPFGVAPVITHVICSMSMWAARSRPGVGMLEAFDRKPGLVNTARGLRSMPAIVQPWTNEEYAYVYTECKQIMARVNPDFVVVESLFSPALTLLAHTGLRNWCIFSSNTIKDLVALEQPNLATLWHYPIMTSGLDFPVPWYKVPTNALLGILSMTIFKKSSRFSGPLKYLRESGQEPDLKRLMMAKDLGVIASQTNGLKVIVASHSSLDFYGLNVPDYMTPVGPVVRCTPPLATVDLPLGWQLATGRTIFVNLGTQMQTTANKAIEMAWALRIMFDEAYKANCHDLRVVWKFKKKNEVPDGVAASAAARSDNHMQLRSRSKTWDCHYGKFKKVEEILGPELSRGRVLLYRWLGPEPKSLLEAGSVVASVHHGSANSFNEAVCAGIPQVVLPTRADCYDCAARVCMLGIGDWGNRRAKPRWHRNELAASLVKVVLSDEAPRIRETCSRLAREFPEHAGRGRAARAVLKEMGRAAAWATQSAWDED